MLCSKILVKEKKLIVLWFPQRFKCITLNFHKILSLTLERFS